MTDRPEGRTSAIVPEVATQAEEIRSRWSWTEPSVWTERMLTALENGVKGGVWYSLIDKVYFKHSYRGTFRPLDGWIRMRLRRILRKRSGKHPEARRVDHWRWPNAFFAAHGLFSMTEAHAALSQSARR